MKTLMCLLLIVASCSFKNKKLDNQTLKGHEELYSEPDEIKLQKLEPNEKRIVIASTNDIQGNYSPTEFTFSDESNKDSQTIKIGGEDVIASYFRILRNTYKDVVLVDSGNIFSDAKSLSDVQSFYQKNKYDAITVGLRDFNLKVSENTGSNSQMFQKFSKSSKVPLLLSNLYELKTARVVEWDGVKPHMMKEINGVKVGIIGLIPDDIVAQTPVNNRVGLFVENMLQSTLRHSRLLRSLGADIIVVLTHQSISCGLEQAAEAKLPVSKVNFEPQRESVCDLKNVLGTYLERLPPQLVDLVIGGRNEHKMVNYVNGTLVMGSFPNGTSFNYAEFVVDTKTKKIVPEKTKVHQPVMFCSEFFKETEDCFYEDKSINHSKRVPATFLGKEIEQSPIAKAEKKSTSTDYLKNLPMVLNNVKADVAYIPQTSGETQLYVMAITGKNLLKILEEDYNQDHKKRWQPSPFIEKENQLKISISGLEINLDKVYRVLTDLESIQNNAILVKAVDAPGSEAIMNWSWTSFNKESAAKRFLAFTKDL
jgi:2',3'-cyclic-nucleotide 2'-phosphodiesterase (5'-nucleotidase family)